MTPPQETAACAWLIRPLGEDDSLEAITALLHRAYRPLAEAGMKFLASWQPVDVTRRRTVGPDKWTLIAAGADSDLGGCITIRRGEADGRCAYYRTPGVFVFGQFAVEPALKGRGLGARLLEAAEDLTRELGASHLALDTSEHAADLIAYYGRRGYAAVDHVRWDGVNYRSVVMSKRLE